MEDVRGVGIRRAAIVESGVVAQDLFAAELQMAHRGEEIHPFERWQDLLQKRFDPWTVACAVRLEDVSAGLAPRFVTPAAVIPLEVVGVQFQLGEKGLAGIHCMGSA